MRFGLAALIVFVSASAVVVAVEIPTVPVGNAGNAKESFGPYGRVTYDYRIGTTEVTNAQYAAFLNAKAASDPLGLYNASMGSGVGGILRSGSDGSYTYTEISGRQNMPVVFVSWYDAIRFANWLHNGQGAGDTETGAYTLLGGTPTPSNGLDIARNPGAVWFLTSENEWYKAAYHKNDGPTGNYWLYPTSSDDPPIAEAPSDGANSVNHDSAVGDLTAAGAYSNSVSPYGTFDQGGNVWEWTERLVSFQYRVLRGGSWSQPGFLNSPTLIGDNPINEAENFGFRVATIPEPSSIVLAAFGLVTVAACRWRRRRRRTL